jgi:hypothetical protein
MVVWLFTQAAQEHIVRNHVWQDDQEADKWVEAIAHNVELFKIQKDPRCAADVSRHTYSLLVGLNVYNLCVALTHACQDMHVVSRRAWHGSAIFLSRYFGQYLLVLQRQRRT